MRRKSELREWLRVEVSGAFPETLLNACAVNALEFWDLECVDACTLRMSVYQCRSGELEAQAERCMCDVKTLSAAGAKSGLRLLARRRWLLLFLLLAAAALTFSSLFIWDIDIYGARELSEGEILRALEDCGVDSGVYWPGISGDLVRSRMIELLPELAWMSVNVNGSRAQVLIAERLEKPEIYDSSGRADIVAAKTGVISNMSVLSGRPLADSGRAVIKGETLVSGTLDSIAGGQRYVRSRAQVEADTWYEISAVRPAQLDIKTGVRRKKNRFALIFGKNRINIYFNGRNQLDGCDKIVHKYSLGIRGLFSLPVELLREELIYYDSQPGAFDDKERMAAQLAASLAEEIDGQVLQRSFSDSTEKGLYRVTMRAHCLENIAQTKEYLP